MCSSDLNDADSGCPTEMADTSILADPEYFVTIPKREKHEQFLRDAFEIIMREGLFEGLSRDQPVLRFHLPEEMKKIIDTGLGQDPVENHQELLHLIELVLKYSVKTGHPHFVNQLYSGYGNVTTGYSENSDLNFYLFSHLTSSDWIPSAFVQIGLQRLSMPQFTRTK